MLPVSDHFPSIEPMSTNELFAIAMDRANDPALNALKKRFADFSACKDHATAAAFGYYAAINDLNEKLKEEEDNEEEPSIYDRVFTVFDQYGREEIESIEECVDLTMALVHNWLKNELTEEGISGYLITMVGEKFEPFSQPSTIQLS